MEVLTTKEVSAILKLGRDKTYALMNSKNFPSYKIGKQCFVTVEALDKWLKNVDGKTIVLQQSMKCRMSRNCYAAFFIEIQANALNVIKSKSVIKV